MARGPVLIDLEDAAELSVADAPPIPDGDALQPDRAAMQRAAQFAAGRTSRLTRWFFGLGAALVGSMASVAAWDFVTGLMMRMPVLGWAVAAVAVAFLIVALGIVLREVAALGRLSRVDGLRRAADTARAEQDLVQARVVSARLEALYRHREETRWGRDRLAALRDDQMDAESLLSLTEAELLVPLDALAAREVEAAARKVAAVTALVPLALADVVAALTANLTMIRRVAEIYGGRSGVIGGWRLARSVFGHMVATGAVAVGDDMLEPVLGGSILGKLSRRFGEGLVNGALTARVGVAAMDVCRPMPFGENRRPRARDLVRRALAGFVSRQGK